MWLALSPVYFSWSSNPPRTTASSASTPFSRSFFNVAWIALWIAWIIAGLVLGAITKGLFFFLQLPIDLAV